jgi:tetratricopeptide (TPR) repeat protein
MLGAPARPAISLCMIVRNEAHRLGACLASVGRAVDEALVVDTGSTDDTVAVAERAGARVVRWAWRDDFAAARNESLRQARGDWALVLDADERLAPAVAGHVRAMVARGDADGVDCRLVSALPAGQPSPTIAAWYCRLFRRRAGIGFEGRIHEQVAPSIRRAGGRILRSDVVILHEGYATPDPAKIERNLGLLALEVAERPDDAFARLNLGLTLQAAGRWAEATPALEQALAATASPLEPRLRAVAWTHLAEARVRERCWPAAESACREALDAEPGLVIARYLLGRARFEQGDLDEAAGCFTGLAALPPDPLGMTLRPHLPAVALALCHLRRRRFAEAVGLLVPVAALDESGESAFHLGNAWLGVRELTRAGAAYKEARARGFADPALDRRLGLCERLGTALPTTDIHASGAGGATRREPAPW